MRYLLSARSAPFSGGHFNPAVSIGLWAGGRFPAAPFLPYVAAQVVGGVTGGAVLFFIASGRADFSVAGGFAANGYGAHSPAGDAPPQRLEKRWLRTHDGAVLRAMGTFELKDFSSYAAAGSAAVTHDGKAASS